MSTFDKIAMVIAFISALLNAGQYISNGSMINGMATILWALAFALYADKYKKSKNTQEAK